MTVRTFVWNVGGGGGGTVWPFGPYIILQRGNVIPFNTKEVRQRLTTHFEGDTYFSS